MRMQVQTFICCCQEIVHKVPARNNTTVVVQNYKHYYNYVFIIRHHYGKDPWTKQAKHHPTVFIYIIKKKNYMYLKPNSLTG
jgi:hypothetical protein